MKSDWTEHSKQLKWFSSGLHNKIIWEFIKICLPKFVIFNAPYA